MYVFDNGRNTWEDQGSKDIFDIDFKLELHIHILNCNKKSSLKTSAWKGGWGVRITFNRLLASNEVGQCLILCL